MIKLSASKLRLCPWACLTLLMVLLTSACTTHSSLTKGLAGNTVTGAPFQHVIFINQAGLAQPQSPHWHVYIEGDGKPVNRWGKPSLNPTPSESLVLEWFRNDPHPALYLGRPCHFTHNDPHCNPAQWTLARYSQQTVNSMMVALNQQLPTAQFTFIGHSGGGTLAVLMGAQHPRTVGVVTAAGNLDVQKWTDYHEFTPLSLSLNPSTQPSLPACIEQVHLAGANDEQILWQWIQSFSQTQPNARFQRLNNTDHRQSWPFWWQVAPISSNIILEDCGKVTPTIHH